MAGGGDRLGSSTVEGRVMAYTVVEAQLEINRTKRQGGAYWSNIVAGILKQAAKEHGTNAANSLIKKCHLESCGWRKKE